MANKTNGIKVEKGSFEYKGKSYFEYFICGNVRGRDVKIKLAPPDKNDKGLYQYFISDIMDEDIVLRKRRFLLYYGLLRNVREVMAVQFVLIAKRLESVRGRKRRQVYGRKH